MNNIEEDTVQFALEMLCVLDEIALEESKNKPFDKDKWDYMLYQKQNMHQIILEETGNFAQWTRNGYILREV